uniref:Endonuclease-reverse transcriptase n=1 Tax=Heliothis virescens TaxID=7102 RepID=A0A2A4J1F3_HELVI
MDEQLQLLFEKIRMEMQKQSNELKESLTKNIMDQMNEKLTPMIEENEKMKEKIYNLEKEIEYLKKEKKTNNIVIYGLEESEKTTFELIQTVKETFKRDLNLSMEENEVNRVYRLGKNRVENKHRPVLLSFTNGWKKDLIMQNKKNLKGIYISEDYSKEVIEKRKALLPQLLEEKKKGNAAFLKYDKLVVKGPNTDKRKRELSISPRSTPTTNPKKQQTISSIKTNKNNAFDLMRTRSNSLTDILTQKEQ